MRARSGTTRRGPGDLDGRLYHRRIQPPASQQPCQDADVAPSGDSAFTSAAALGRAPEMTYGGALSFLRRRYSRDAASSDIVVSGVPFDAASSNRPGARLGPRAIRAASVGLAQTDAYPFGFDPFDHLVVTDYGDCFLDYGHPADATGLIEHHASTILSEGAAMVTLGGDHFITYPILRAHADKHGPLALVHFDAHPDTWDDTQGRLDHGSMFLRALREGIIDPSASVQIGIRTHNDDHGFCVLGASWVHRNGPAAALDAICERVGGRKAYLTFDIDCIDPAFAPGTGTPVPGGLTTAQALEIVRGLAPLDIVGADVVEVAPVYDVSEITALAAATIAHDFICTRAVRAGAAIQPVGLT